MVAQDADSPHGATVNTRRSFFARMGAAIATIALAPELAFRAKLALPEVEKFWTQDQCHSRSYNEGYLRAVGLTFASNQPFQIPPENYEHA